MLYNFASASVDRETFRFELWRRYIKSALRQDERLLSYGEPQGEYDLREVLCRYLQNNRNVVCTPEHIVIGAGVQSLLHILCPLIEGRKKLRFIIRDFGRGVPFLRIMVLNCAIENRSSRMSAMCHLRRRLPGAMFFRSESG